MDIQISMCVFFTFSFSFSLAIEEEQKRKKRTKTKYKLIENNAYRNVDDVPEKGQRKIEFNDWKKSAYIFISMLYA